MGYTYRLIQDPAEHAEIYRRLKEEDLLWCLFSEIEPDEWSEDLYIKLHNSASVRDTWGGYIDGRLAGLAYVWPFRGSYRTRCAEIGLTAFRDYFKEAAPLCRRGLLHAIDHYNSTDRVLASLVGCVPAPNRHIVSMLGQIGFVKQCRIPKLFWFTKIQKHVDGWFVSATPESIARVEAVSK